MNDPLPTGAVSVPELSTSATAINAKTFLARSVKCDYQNLEVCLKDERVVKVPLNWFPFLVEACAAQKSNCVITDGGASLHWPDLNRDISIAELVAGLRNADREKALEATVAYAQSLTQWGLLMIAGTAVVLLSSEYTRPANNYFVYVYLLFIPGWISLIFSMYEGVRLQQAYLSYLFRDNANWFQTMNALNAKALWQVRGMKLAVSAFGLWLVAYLVFWIFWYQKPN